MVMQTFNEYDHKLLNRIWLTYMMVLNKILESNGGNDYTLGHMKKAKLERLGQLPLRIQANLLADQPAEENEENEPPLQVAQI